MHLISHSTSLTSVITIFNVSPSLPTSPFLLHFPTKTLYAFHSCPIRATFPVPRILLCVCILISDNGMIEIMKLLAADFPQTSSCFIPLRLQYFLKYFFSRAQTLCVLPLTWETKSPTHTAQQVKLQTWIFFNFHVLEKRWKHTGFWTERQQASPEFSLLRDCRFDGWCQSEISEICQIFEGFTGHRQVFDIVILMTTKEHKFSCSAFTSR